MIFRLLIAVLITCLFIRFVRSPLFYQLIGKIPDRSKKIKLPKMTDEIRAIFETEYDDEILNGLTSRDSHKIWSASCEIASLRDRERLKNIANHIDEIQLLTEGVDLGGMIRSNSSHLNFAINKLKFVLAGDACLCHLYPKRDFYDPDKEQESGNVQIDHKEALEGGWYEYCLVSCLECGNKFKVEEKDYHFSYWVWTDA